MSPFHTSMPIFSTKKNLIHNNEITSETENYKSAFKKKKKEQKKQPLTSYIQMSKLIKYLHSHFVQPAIRQIYMSYREQVQFTTFCIGEIKSKHFKYTDNTDF